jgi:hypothetical protein
MTFGTVASCGERALFVSSRAPAAAGTKGRQMKSRTTLLYRLPNALSVLLSLSVGLTCLLGGSLTAAVLASGRIFG